MFTEIILITIISFISGTLTSALGFGAGLLLTPLLTFIMPIKEALAVSGLVFLVTSGSKAYLYRNEIVKKLYVKGLMLSLFGLAVGAMCVTVIDAYYLEKFLAFALVYFSVNSFRRKDGEKSLIPTNIFPVLGGFMSIMTHSGGIFFFKYCRINGLDRLKTVGTLAGVHFTLNIFKAMFFVISGFAASSYIYTLTPAYISSILGTYMGRHILKHYMNEDIFAKGVGVMLMLLAIKFMLFE